MYKVSFARGIAEEEYFTPSKNIVHNTFAVLMDGYGLYILTARGKVYLNNTNSIFL